MKEWISGRNPILEVLRAHRRQVFRLWLAKGIVEDQRVKEILQLVRESAVVVEVVDRSQLDNIVENHQGMAMQVSAYPYVDLHTILRQSQTSKELPFLLLLDQLQDPQNFGTLIRSARAFGVHGIVIPPSRAVGVTASVVHASSGASEHLLIAQGNLAQAIEFLKSNDVWILGLEGSAEHPPISQVNLNVAMAVVVGSEGSGLRPLVRRSCDFLAHIPMTRGMESLNAAVAGSIALFLIYQSRSKIGEVAR
jgi:23S rRNA (guanosine2251-2'-O)-methyltransferase